MSRARPLTHPRVLATFTLPPDHTRVAIVTPLIEGGSLAGVLEWRRGNSAASGTSRSTALDEDETKAVIRQVIDGLVYLHANGFLHVRVHSVWTCVPSD